LFSWKIDPFLSKQCENEKHVKIGSEYFQMVGRGFACENIAIPFEMRHNRQRMHWRIAKDGKCLAAVSAQLDSRAVT
jgi:hypothetical protein